MIIQSISNNLDGEFTDFILKDLIDQGLSGESLLQEFCIMQAKIRPAVERMLDDDKKTVYDKVNIQH